MFGYQKVRNDVSMYFRMRLRQAAEVVVLLPAPTEV